MAENPIIRGFNPDPSIIRIGEDYFIATSTFEWWPGVNIYRSRDLVNWVLHSRPLDDVRLLNLTGVPDGGGVWAPDLSFDGEKVYLVYTNVRERGAMMQTDNFLTETDDINGSWSDCVYLNSLGFDPSLFHDDGRTYLVSLDNHYSEGKRFNGLFIQEYDKEKRQLTGRRRRLYEEPRGELVEGAHVYKFCGKYFLLKAQGGTGERHSAQLSRSDSLFGPWEDMPSILLHARSGNPPLKKAGHGSLVASPEGKIYMAHLAAREIDAGCCVFGRETCLQSLSWGGDGWLHLDGGGENPQLELPVSGERKNADDKYYDFKKGVMPDSFQSLRLPLGKRASFTGRGLRLTGGDGLLSRFEQTLLARRIDSENISASVKLYFEPECEKHLAGLIFIYDTRHWHYLYVTRDDKSGEKIVSVMTCDGGKITFPTRGCLIEGSESVVLKAEMKKRLLCFSFDNGKGFKDVCECDMKILSDEHVPLGFTGAMVGMCCQDLVRKEKYAEFEYMTYIQKGNGRKI